MSAVRPTGLVTFLLTDVERSTRQWEEAPEAMALALAEHDKILRAEIEDRGGYIFSRAGDAVAAAFSTPVAAAKAALAAQESLRARSALRVRMGLHTGTSEERDDDYFGPTVNRTARLR